ncbi:uncharacterized protein GGS25DRAFT_514781 [Hypoxylon fragiforme]|uniref:uncharacterized protein n=1 Tax=Hypoxylon fragiforme TaxID=63214 RepID=UPI0020C6713A|nr:uncharacterized protein GGS25DRAFT_514781 [Hypoxylon fragiforme]KAI2607412.1 hypothetical protein GGS25DRAFT_514781 [Hypoxylon fragiforme]
MRPPMRSSIACVHCRRSKIKCENDGGISACDSCVKTGKHCSYTPPETNAPKRAEPPVGVKQERDGGSDRKKLKKIEDISKLDNHRATIFTEDVLSAPFLTEDLWEQLLDLYKLHFAPELPFLHLPTMKEKLGRKFRGSQSDNGSDFNLVLLGILTLTARFHPDLVRYLAHICNNQSGNARSRPVHTQLDPVLASEYYADVLTMALGPLRTAMNVASVERVAAFLMLGLFEWSQTKPKTGGLGAWMYVGVAIRMAQYLRLGFGDVPDPADPKVIEYDHKSSGEQSRMALEKEVRRRTMFSCLILDRMLSCGRERVSIIQSDELQIQLPCSEDKFDLAMEAPTGFIKDKRRHGLDDSVLSRFIQLVDLWGDVAKFSSSGGRLNKKERETPPWYPESTFFQLTKRLAEFDKELPDTFTFSQSNYFKHENHQASSVYVLLHMLRCICLIMLHREYIPFVPISCEKPVGPVDQPTFPPETYGSPPDGFWTASAELVFKAARGIVDLLEICQRKNKLPQSTIVLFAIWTASFVGLYAEHFPLMDTQKHMLEYDYENIHEPETAIEVFRRGSVAFTLEALRKMATWQQMASTYVLILGQMDKFFETIKEDYYRFAANNKEVAGNPSLWLRHGGKGGALEEYKPLSSTLKDFGAVQPEEANHVDSSGRLSPSVVDKLPASGVDLIKPKFKKSPRITPSGSFTAINHIPIMPASEQFLAEKLAADPGYLGTLTLEGGFWPSFKKEEGRRIGAIGDLGLFSSGVSKHAVTELPFGESSHIPSLSDSSYEFLQQIAEL